MADRSKIEWTDSSWTPIRAVRRSDSRKGWHCEHVSPGCKNCYAEAMNLRLGTGLPFKPGHVLDVEIRLEPHLLDQPIRWAKPRMIFVCSMTDLFGEFVPTDVIDYIFAVMALCPWHTFQVITKRSARMRAYLSDPATIRRVYEAACDLAIDLSLSKVVLIAPGVSPALAPPGPRIYLDTWPLPNVWIGVSAEDQRRVIERVPDLLGAPAAVRFISAEPLLGRIDFRHIAVASNVSLDALSGQFTATASFSGGLANFQAGLDALPPLPSRRPVLDWIIIGGESGRDARPMHPDWARGLRDQCAAAGVPLFFKQWSEWIYTHPKWPHAVPTVMANDGTLYASCDLAYPEGARYGEALRAGHDKAHLTNMYRVGKKAAGRLLDGIEHNGMPERTPSLAGAA